MGQNNNINKENSSEYDLGDLSNNLLNDLDINTLKSEVNRISNAIEDDEIDLSPDEKIKLEKDLELISELISTKLNENLSISHEFSNESLIVAVSDSVDVEEDVVAVSDSVDVEEDVVAVSDLILLMLKRMLWLFLILLMLKRMLWLFLILLMLKLMI